LVQAFLKKWWVETDLKVPFHYGSKFPAVTITVFITILEENSLAEPEILFYKIIVVPS
jgi:hypothetical protein